MSHALARLLTAVMFAAAFASPLTSFAQVVEETTPEPRSSPSRIEPPAELDEPMGDGRLARAEERIESYDFLPDERPTSVDAYLELRRDLRDRIEQARARGAVDALRAAQRDLETAETWFREDTVRRSRGAIAGGIVLSSVGGATVAVGVSVAALGPGAEGPGGGLAAAGLLLAACGVPLLVWGAQREMGDERRLASGAAGRVVLGPDGAHVEGAF